MDVYDFDGTLYRGDSTRDFLMWCVRRHPQAALTLPRTGIAATACLGLRAIDKTRFKRALYRFIRAVPDIEAEVGRFWRANERKVGGPCDPQPGDVVVSAGPEFLLRDVCAQRGLELISSQVDPHTGVTLGPNCSGTEKVARFRERFPEAKVRRFFSDSLGDAPLAGIADEALLVNIPRNRLEPWPRK